MSLTLEDIYAVLTKYGAMTPNEVFRHLRNDRPEEDANKLYANTVSRLKYGVTAKAFSRIKKPGRRPLYMANVDWKRADYGRRGGRTKHEFRAIVLRMRDGPKRHTWAEIGAELNVTPQAAASMYQRIKGGVGNSTGEKPETTESYSVLEN